VTIFLRDKTRAFKRGESEIRKGRTETFHGSIEIHRIQDLAVGATSLIDRRPP